MEKTAANPQTFVPFPDNPASLREPLGKYYHQTRLASEALLLVLLLGGPLRICILHVYPIIFKDKSRRGLYTI